MRGGSNLFGQVVGNAGGNVPKRCQAVQVARWVNQYFAGCKWVWGKSADRLVAVNQ